LVEFVGSSVTHNCVISVGIIRMVRRFVLIQRNCERERYNGEGEYPLTIACQRHAGDIAVMLANSGADISAVPGELEAAELIDETVRERKADEMREERLADFGKRRRGEFEFHQRLEEETGKRRARDSFLRHYEEGFSSSSAMASRDRLIRQEREAEQRESERRTDGERTRNAERDRFEDMRKEEINREHYKNGRPCEFPRLDENPQEEDERRFLLFDKQVGVIAFGDIPWPQIDRWAMSTSANDKKQLLLRWHPDKFLPRVDGRVLQTDVERVRNTCNEVCGRITSLVQG